MFFSTVFMQFKYIFTVHGGVQNKNTIISNDQKETGFYWFNLKGLKLLNPKKYLWKYLMEQYAQNEKKILVAKSESIRVRRGNIRGRQVDGKQIDIHSNTPLPKWKKERVPTLKYSKLCITLIYFLHYLEMSRSVVVAKPLILSVNILFSLFVYIFGFVTTFFWYWQACAMLVVSTGNSVLLYLETEIVAVAQSRPQNNFEK